MSCILFVDSVGRIQSWSWVRQPFVSGHLHGRRWECEGVTMERNRDRDPGPGKKISRKRLAQATAKSSIKTKTINTNSSNPLAIRASFRRTSTLNPKARKNTQNTAPMHSRQARYKTNKCSIIPSHLRPSILPWYHVLVPVFSSFGTKFWISVDVISSTLDVG